jgi:hypothetical protein
MWKTCQEGDPKSKVMAPHSMLLTRRQLQRYLAVDQFPLTHCHIFGRFIIGILKIQIEKEIAP